MNKVDIVNAALAWLGRDLAKERPVSKEKKVHLEFKGRGDMACGISHEKLKVKFRTFNRGKVTCQKCKDSCK